MTTLAPIMWPATLPVNNLMFQLENMSRGGGPSLSGREQIVSSPSGRWTASFDTVLGTKSEIACYRAMMARLEGRANTILISPCEPTFSPAGLAGSAASVQAPFGQASGQSPTALFSDGSQFEQDGTYALAISTGAAGAITLQMSCTPPPLVGTYFSLTPTGSPDDWQLYLIRSFLFGSGSPWSGGFSSAFGPVNQYIVSIDPPLRSPVNVSTRLNFGRPLCRMRLTSDTAGPLTRTRTAWSTPSLKFVEVF